MREKPKHTPGPLEALKELLERCQGYCDEGPPGEGWQSEELKAAIRDAHEAIAKAEGGA